MSACPIDIIPICLSIVEWNIFQQFPRRLLTVETLPTFKTVPAVGGGKYHFKLAAVRLCDRG